MSMIHKILIAGTGRAGTTFLMAVLTDVGIDTGFDKDHVIAVSKKNSKGGLEYEIGFIKKHVKKPINTPYVIKCPKYSRLIKKISKKYSIDHVYIPIRDVNEVTKSRLSLSRRSGGLWGAIDGKTQKNFLYKTLGLLIHDLVLMNIPYTFLNFNELISNPNYVYKQMKLVLKSIKKNDFIKSFNKMSLIFKRVAK